MKKVITTYFEYDPELHKDILGRQFDKDGNEFYYQPERLSEKTVIDGSDSLNSMETWRGESEEVFPPT